MPLLRPVSRPRRGVAAALAAACAVAVLLSGCTGGDPAASPAPSADAAEPIFATDEEALAAAESAYDQYRTTSAMILAEGGAAPERIVPFVTATYAVTLAEEFEAFRSAGARTIGDSTIDTVSLVDRSEADDSAEVSIYLCRDLTSVRVLGPDSSDITPSDRQNRVPSHVFLVSSADEASVLIVDRVEKWQGEDFC